LQITQHQMTDRKDDNEQGGSDIKEVIIA